MGERSLNILIPPLILTLGVVILDQITKLWIIQTVPLNTIGFQVIGDFLRIIHVRNTGVAFSLGNTWAAPVRMVLFVGLPLVVLGGLLVYYFRTDEFTRLQRWAIGGIIGGGLGNIIDRIFRPEGVVDFVDVRFFGLFGMERFPTFNVADSSVVVCGILLLISLFIHERTMAQKSIAPESTEGDSHE